MKGKPHRSLIKGLTMSCWSLESPLSFMIAAGREAQAATAGMAETHLYRGHLLGSLFRLPLPDNPKPTTRLRPEP